MKTDPSGTTTILGCREGKTNEGPVFFVKMERSSLHTESMPEVMNIVSTTLFSIMVNAKLLKWKAMILAVGTTPYATRKLLPDTQFFSILFLLIVLPIIFIISGNWTSIGRMSFVIAEQD